MALVTVEDLTNAALDAQTLADFVNGAADRSNPGQADGTVTARVGRVLKVIAKLQAEIEAQIAAMVSGTGIFVAAANYATGAGGSPVAPSNSVGPLTPGSATRSSAGNWTIPIAGLTTGAVVVVTPSHGYSAMMSYTASAGSLAVLAQTTGAVDVDVSFTVVVSAL